MSETRHPVSAEVAVIIVNWNGERFLERCLNSVAAQTVTPDAVIFVDNASTDRSIEIAQRFPFVRIIELPQNVGFAKGNNLALDRVPPDVEWIALLNPDAFAEPRWLESLLEAAECRREFDMFGGQIVKAAEPTRLDGTGDVYHVSGRVWRSLHGVSVSSAGDNGWEIFSPCAAAALYRRSALIEVGGFDEDFFCYIEDVDLGFRLRLAGSRCLYVPQSVVHHVGSGTTGGQHSSFSVYHGHRNLLWTFVKNMPSLLFWLLLPLHVALNLGSVIWFVLRGQARVIIRAKRDALLGLPKMWRKRQQIQAVRVASIGDIWRVLDKRLIPTRRNR